MKFRILLLAACVAVLASCNHPQAEEEIISSLKQIQTTLPKDLGSGVTYQKAFYEKETKTIVFGYSVERLQEPFPQEAINVLKQVTITNLNQPAVAADPIWKLAARANATFRYEYFLPDGSPAGSFTLKKWEYRRR